MIFIDSNIPMYLVGADHPNKRECLLVLEDLITKREALVTNAEVLQEILHRYTAIQRKDFIQPAFDALEGFIDEIFDITAEDTLKAKDLLLSHQNLTARDALHAAQMKRLKINTLFSFDQGFDRITGIRRIPQ